MKRARPSPLPELMDDPRLPRSETERALADLHRVNRWLLGLRVAVRAVLPWIERGPALQSLLDLGTGAGHVPAALATAAGRRGLSLTVAGIDRKLDHLLIGRRDGIEQLRVVADAESLPFREASFDWSFSNLFFHHFDSKRNLGIVAEMRRVARRGVVLVDLRRSRLARLLATCMLPVLRVAHVAAYDGRLSVAQAWTVEEVGRLMQAFEVRELRRRFPFRWSLVLAPRDGR